MDRHGKKMNKESLEHLSCLMDGEISRDTSRFLVRRLGSDSELRATWARYHVVRDCLRHHEGNLAGDEFCNRVQNALAEDIPAVAARSSVGRWLKPVAGAAIAASVALMAIVTVGPGQSPGGDPAGELAGSPQLESFVSPNNGLSSSPVSQQASLAGSRGMTSQRMNSYFLRHHQVAGSTAGKGFITFVPYVVAQGAGQQSTEEEVKTSEADLKDGNENR
jgi:sigma-E factor negative regulatory protein RseA